MGGRSIVKQKKLDFTIGPVQGFVAQSRRMKDLLNSSFLLSYLAGHAMVEVICRGGTIDFPYVMTKEREIINPLLQDIKEFRKNKYQPLSRGGTWIGSLPNRFQATVPETFQPQRCVDAVKNAWKRMADQVWDEYVSPVANEHTKAIWDRQVKHFWEIQWVLQEIEDETQQTGAQTVRFLDFRKFWRDHVPAVEPGDKCQLIPRLQELSGIERHSDKGRDKQESFWTNLRNEIKTLDLGENERLCAVSLIKRLVSSKEISPKAIGWRFEEEAVHFPSFPYIAAYPWIKQAVQTQKDAARKFAEAAKKAGVKRPYKLPLEKFGVQEKDTLLETFVQLEGPAFFGRWELDEKVDDTELTQKHQELVIAMGGPPSPYFGLLLMDGDQLGQLLQTNSSWVSQSLNRFTEKIQELIPKYEGVPVYAGGDDVLALFPLHQILPAALEIRQQYMKAFDEVKNEVIPEETDLPAPTVSAGVIFAHAYTPIKNVLRYAHVLLDDVAKGQNGRDSIAVSIWRHSGPDLIWVSKWGKSIQMYDGKSTLNLELLAQQWQDEETFLSSSFLHKWLEFFERSYGNIEASEWRSMAVELMTADYLRIVGNERKVTKEEAKEKIEALLDVCLVSDQFQPDGMFLVRFLKQKGVEQHGE